MSKKLTILFFPVQSHGNVNASHGLAQVLVQRGHRVVFAVDIAWKGLLVKYGFEERIFATENNNGINGINKFVWSQFIEKNELAMSEPPHIKIKKFIIPAFTLMLQKHKSLENQYKSIISEVKPDIIVIDHLVCSPILTNSGIPWVWFFSPAPLCCIDHDQTPPARSGNYR